MGLELNLAVVIAEHDVERGLRDLVFSPSLSAFADNTLPPKKPSARLTLGAKPFIEKSPFPCDLGWGCALLW